MIKKKLVVVTGEYEAGGQMKKRYRTIGHIHEGQYGHYITLDSLTNLAAIPRKEGDDRVYVNMYDPDPPREGARSTQEPPAAPRQGQGQGSGAVQESFDDDMPF